MTLIEYRLGRQPRGELQFCEASVTVASNKYKIIVFHLSKYLHLYHPFISIYLSSIYLSILPLYLYIYHLLSVTIYLVIAKQHLIHVSCSSYCSLFYWYTVIFLLVTYVMKDQVFKETLEWYSSCRQLHSLCLLSKVFLIPEAVHSFSFIFQ